MTPQIIVQALETRQNILLVVFIALHATVMLLRIAVHLGIRAHTLILNFCKPLKTLDEVNRVTSPLLRRIAAEYILSAKKNPAEAPLAAIVEKHVLALSLFGWRYAGIKIWVEKMENTLVLLGLLLAIVFHQHAIDYALIAIAGFLLMKLLGAFFEFNSAEAILKSGLVVYLQREVGAFFAGHTSAAILKFKEEMAASLEKLQVHWQECIIGFNRELASPLAALSHLHHLQDISRAAENFARAGDAFNSENFTEQSELIRQNQRALEKALESYEIAMQALVQTMGDGLGTFIQLYSKTASEQLSEALQATRRAE